MAKAAAPKSRAKGRKPAGLDEATLRRWHRRMLLIRKFDEMADKLFQEGHVKGSIHTSIGQEAVSMGVCANLTREDVIVSTHRGHGSAIAKGSDVKAMMAELLGRRTGLCKGKGGSMHIADLPHGLYGANPIVGANIPIAAGIALSFRLRKKPNVCVSLFGDGASNQGTFHEGLNMAAIWKLPVIYVCENNGYAVSFSTGRSTSVADIADRARGYDIPGVVVDGMDVLEVYEAAKQAVERARAGKGPSLLEMKTYRFRGHSRGDPPSGVYRTKEELERWLAKDSIARLEKHLKMTKEEVQAVSAAVDAEIQEAVQFALSSEFPAPEEALEDIYA
ncbi:MAG: thiamine pyrophosphate-dependent dehydrogenase E1 component subunit alpha [Candidatus Tectomicrobia bacterium]|nr:thiamine pyrophosphate-dependent dehydrogenase E1 component subunit alpha [Candidatus Tectomicrobia bacterium]